MDPNPAIFAHAVFPQFGHIRPEKTAVFPKISTFFQIRTHLNLRTAHRRPMYRIKVNGNPYQMQKTCDFNKCLGLSDPLNFDISQKYQGTFGDIFRNHGEIQHVA